MKDIREWKARDRFLAVILSLIVFMLAVTWGTLEKRITGILLTLFS